MIPSNINRNPVEKVRVLHKFFPTVIAYVFTFSALFHSFHSPYYDNE